jgi:hypothetical protein
MRSSKLLTLSIAALLCGAPAVAATDSDALARALEQVNQRLDQLEQQNRSLNQQVGELTRQNETLRASAQKPVQAAPAVAPEATDWQSRISFDGDFRFRHEHIDNEPSGHGRQAETIRARLSAKVKVNDQVDGEIGLGTGGRDPRGGSNGLGAASARQDIGLDLAYMRWHATDELSVTAGKMREPYVRPGNSLFFSDEVRPEGIAVNYANQGGVFGTAFNFWVEERAAAADSMLRGAQGGWKGSFGDTEFRAGAGYFDYHNVEGRNPNFGGGVVNQFGNTVIVTSAGPVFAYDYNIGQIFTDASLPVAGLPVTLFVDYAKNFEADDFDTAYSTGVVVGRANAPGRWQAGVLKQKVEKDALFGQWTHPDFAGGVTDNDGYVWQAGWMAFERVVLNLTYFDSKYNVDVGPEANYDRLQLDFNFNF